MENLTIIEMVAYAALHSAEATKWRCMICQESAKHTEEGVMKHLIDDHKISKKLLRKEKGEEIFKYPK